MASRGIDMIVPADGVRMFERILTSGRAQAVAVPVRWPRLLESYPRGSEPRLLEAFVALSRPRESADAPTSDRAWIDIVAAPASEQLALIETLVAVEVRRVAGIPAASPLDYAAEWTTLGLDSLMAVELKNRLESVTRQRLSIGELLQAGCVKALARTLHRAVDSADRAPDYRPLVETAAVEEGEL